MRLSLQELKELLAHLGHDRAHVVPSDGVTVVQVHHSLFQVAVVEERDRIQVGSGKWECPLVALRPRGTADGGWGGVGGEGSSKPEMGGNRDGRKLGSRVRQKSLL